jgi:hypothetical protein
METLAGVTRAIQMMPSGLYAFGPGEKFYISSKQKPPPSGQWVGMVKVPSVTGVLETQAKFRRVKTTGKHSNSPGSRGQMARSCKRPETQFARLRRWKREKARMEARRHEHHCPKGGHDFGCTSAHAVYHREKNCFPCNIREKRRRRERRAGAQQKFELIEAVQVKTNAVIA